MSNLGLCTTKVVQESIHLLNTNVILLIKNVIFKFQTIFTTNSSFYHPLKKEIISNKKGFFLKNILKKFNI